MPNEKVSHLTAITAGELSSGDLFLISDISAKESKRMESSQLLLFFEVSGTFNAATADLADTASYILGTGVDGLVESSSYSITSSYSDIANSVNTASYALTASVTLACVTHTITADTASLLLYTGDYNGTASYSITSSLAINVKTASYLQYLGVSNGTASFSISSSHSNLAVTSSFGITSSYSISASNSENSATSSYSLLGNTASYALTAPNSVKAWCSLSWSYGANYPEIISSFNIKPQLGNGIENGGGIQYITVFPSPPDTVALFGVRFQTPLSSSKYSFLGAGATYMDPIIASPTIYGFTMSINVGISGWYTTPPASRLWYSPKGFDSFTIFG